MSKQRSALTKATASKPNHDDNQLFYETMPLDLGQHSVYRDDRPSKADHEYSQDDKITPDVSRRVALTTLVVVVVIAAIAGLILAESIAVLQNISNSGSALTP